MIGPRIVLVAIYTMAEKLLYVDMAHLVKSLEFDRVIVADVSTANYRTEVDRNLLYMACTRAMHRLTLYSTGEPSSLLLSPAQG